MKSYKSQGAIVIREFDRAVKQRIITKNRFAVDVYIPVRTEAQKDKIYREYEINYEKAKNKSKSAGGRGWFLDVGPKMSREAFINRFNAAEKEQLVGVVTNDRKKSTTDPMQSVLKGQEIRPNYNLKNVGPYGISNSQAQKMSVGIEHYTGKQYTVGQILRGEVPDEILQQYEDGLKSDLEIMGQDWVSENVYGSPK